MPEMSRLPTRKTTDSLSSYRPVDAQGVSLGRYSTAVSNPERPHLVRPRSIAAPDRSFNRSLQRFVGAVEGTLNSLGRDYVRAAREAEDDEDWVKLQQALGGVNDQQALDAIQKSVSEAADSDTRNGLAPFSSNPRVNHTYYAGLGAKASGPFLRALEDDERIRAFRKGEFEGDIVEVFNEHRENYLANTKGMDNASVRVGFMKATDEVFSQQAAAWQQENEDAFTTKTVDTVLENVQAVIGDLIEETERGYPTDAGKAAQIEELWAVLNAHPDATAVQTRAIQAIMNTYLTDENVEDDDAVVAVLGELQLGSTKAGSAQNAQLFQAMRNNASKLVQDRTVGQNVNEARLAVADRANETAAEDLVRGTIAPVVTKARQDGANDEQVLQVYTEYRDTFLDGTLSLNDQAAAKAILHYDSEMDVLKERIRNAKTVDRQTSAAADKEILDIAKRDLAEGNTPSEETVNNWSTSLSDAGVAELHLIIAGDTVKNVQEMYNVGGLSNQKKLAEARLTAALAQYKGVDLEVDHDVALALFPLVTELDDEIARRAKTGETATDWIPGWVDKKIHTMEASHEEKTVQQSVDVVEALQAVDAESPKGWSDWSKGASKAMEDAVSPQGLRRSFEAENTGLRPKGYTNRKYNRLFRELTDFPTQKRDQLNSGSLPRNEVSPYLDMVDQMLITMPTVYTGYDMIYADSKDPDVRAEALRQRNKVMEIHQGFRAESTKGFSLTELRQGVDCFGIPMKTWKNGLISLNPKESFVLTPEEITNPAAHRDSIATKAKLLGVKNPEGTAIIGVTGEELLEQQRTLYQHLAAYTPKNATGK